MGYLIRGSLAVDSILTHEGSFDTRIIPSEISRLNVCFDIDLHRQEPGGTAGNIAWNAVLLGDLPLVNASVGENDSGFWQERLESMGLSTDGLREVPGTGCPRAWIITDQNNNQITAFHPGSLSTPPRLPDDLAANGVRLALLSADIRESFDHAVAGLVGQGIPYVLDPGQSLPSMLRDAGWFAGVLRGSECVFVNDYEAELCSGALGVDFASLTAQGWCPMAVRTMGAAGCQVYVGANAVFIPSCKAEAVVDPTGCGDAFRAGFLHGLLRGWNPVQSARLGAVMGSFAVEKSGGQRHSPSRISIAERFSANFGGVPDGFF